MIRNILILVLLILTSCKTTKLTPNKAIEKLGANPYFEIDGQPIKQNDLGKYNPNDIASLTTYYKKDATTRFGRKAVDGAVIIETKVLAKSRYETLFKKSSKDYEEVLKEYDREDIQYILNDRILTKDFEGTLASIDDNLLKDIKIIDQKELLDKFKVGNKKIGVIIRANSPKNLYNSKKKF